MQWNLVNRLPYDIQEKIAMHYLKIERINNLNRQQPITIKKKFSKMIPVYNYMTGKRLQSNFTLEIHFFCDKNDLVWAFCTNKCNFMYGLSYNIYIIYH